MYNPGLGAIIVTVTSARTVSAAAAPVWAERPLGTSAATTTVPRTRASFRTRIHLSKGAFTASWEKPVPRMASMARGDAARRSATSPSSGATSTAARSLRAARALSAAERADSAVRSSGARAVTTRTGIPHASRYSAATQPSPPLLPLPQKTTTESSRRKPLCRAPSAAAGPSEPAATPTATSGASAPAGALSATTFPPAVLPSSILRAS